MPLKIDSRRIEPMGKSGRTSTGRDNNTDGTGRYLRADGITIDLQERKVWCGTDEQSLTAKTLDLLVYLMSRPQTLVSKDELFESLWDGKAVSEAVLTTAVKDARRALGDKARAPTYLATVHGHGYRFLKPVVATDMFDGGISDPQPTQTPKSEIEAKNWPLPEKAVFGLIGAAILVVVSIIAMAITNQKSDDVAQSSSPQAIQQSIAVLPFDDFSQHQDQRWFGDGLAEEILNTLAAREDLLVASRRSAFEFREPGTNIRDIANILGVSHVLEGSIRDNNNDDKIRITVQLIRASDGFHIWSETYDRDIVASDLFEVQEDISLAIATKLGLPMAVPSGNNRFTNSTEAYRSFLRAKETMRRRDAQSVERAIAEFESAIALDPEYGPAHAGMAEALIYSAMYANSEATWEEIKPKVARTIDQAMALAPDSSDPFRAASFFALVTQRYDDALNFANTALINNPNDVDAYQRRGVLFTNINRNEDALRDLYSALQREPVSPIIMVNITQIEAELGNTDVAEKIAQQNLEINPDSFLAVSGMAQLHLMKGEYIAAFQYLSKAQKQNPFGELTNRHLAELKWRLGFADQEYLSNIESTWTAAGAHYLSIGEREKALKIARDNEQFVKSGLSSHIFYYWGGEIEDAYRLARPYADRMGLTNAASYEFTNIKDIVSIIRIFELANDDQADRMRAQYTMHIDGKKPSDIALPDRVYLVASWHMLNGDTDEALRWIDYMLDNGFVPREMMLDPIFEPIRNSEAFKNRVSQLNENAKVHRSAIERTIPTQTQTP